MDKPSDLDAADTLVASEASQRKRAGLLVDDVMRVRLVPSATETEPRCLTEGELGKGGMGVVNLVRDRRIGRRVATKRLRVEVASDAGTRARFLREAQVQGQLEHPAVVPVYDLGVEEDGTAYFTMRSVRGLTLHEIIAGLRNGDVELARKHTRHRLLSAFAGVCLAI